MAYQYGCRPNRDPHKVGRRGCAVTSILRSKALAQGQFTCPEDVNSRPEGSQTRRRVWDMQTEFYLGKNFL